MEITKRVDHTILKADASRADVSRLCEEAKDYGFASVCVNPCHVELVAKHLKDSGVKTCTVIGFPLGATTTATKVFEAVEAIKNGADEVDMVINIGAVIDGDYDFVYEDIRAVVEAAHKHHALVKVIIETCLLNDEQKVKVCELCVKAGAEFVKTSTGFSTGGATVHDVALMKKTVAGKAMVKASGGVRTLADATAMVEAGADRIGTSNGIAFVKS